MSKKVVSKSQYIAPYDLYGMAITYTCIDEEGKMWIGNDEYETQVNYCPMTGEKAPVQMNFKEKSTTYSNPNYIYKLYTNE